MSPNGVHWPMCRPMEFSVSPTVVEPTIGPIVEPKEQVDNSESPSLAPNPLVDIANGSEADKESNFLASEAVEIGNKVAIIRSEDEKEISDLNPHGVLSSGDQPNHSNTLDDQVSRHPQKIDSEKTLNILISGRRNRKQTLRMPISLLKRPYSSESFKVVYSRVLRESEALKSSSFTSNENTITSGK